MKHVWKHFFNPFWDFMLDHVSLRGSAGCTINPWIRLCHMASSWGLGLWIFMDSLLADFGCFVCQIYDRCGLLRYVMNFSEFWLLMPLLTWQLKWIHDSIADVDIQQKLLLLRSSQFVSSFLFPNHLSTMAWCGWPGHPGLWKLTSHANKAPLTSPELLQEQLQSGAPSVDSSTSRGTFFWKSQLGAQDSYPQHSCANQQPPLPAVQRVWNLVSDNFGCKMVVSISENSLNIHWVIDKTKHVIPFPLVFSRCFITIKNLEQITGLRDPCMNPYMAWSPLVNLKCFYTTRNQKVIGLCSICDPGYGL